MTYPTPVAAPPKPTGLPRLGTACEEVPVRSQRLLAAVTLPACPESVPLLRRTARQVVRGCRLSERVDEAVTLIVSELAANAVLHSGSADVALLIEVGDTAVTVRIRDNGQWHERQAPRCEAADVDTAFGRGLSLVDAYAVDTSIVRGPTGTVVQAVVTL
ncbi:ATP-binding protein [Streptomyces sp. NPDC008313]|uniref:ATP-binding protein n=1 Tax=Streptomyces sp. NPDC008313 TaxID=3364826 RepID=UPI0036ED008A